MKRSFQRTAITGSLAVTLVAVGVGTALATTSDPATSQRPVRTDRATDISFDHAGMNGGITTGGVEVKWQFFWGTGRRLTHHTPLRTIPASTSKTALGANTNSRLARATTYRFVLVATYESRHAKTVAGVVRSFTTKAGAIRATLHRVTASRDVAAIPLTCYSRQTCKGTLLITDRVKRSPDGTFYRTATFGHEGFSIPPGMTSKIDVKLTPNTIKRLRSAPKQSLLVTLKAPTATNEVNFFRQITLML